MLLGPPIRCQNAGSVQLTAKQMLPSAGSTCCVDEENDGKLVVCLSDIEQSGYTQRWQVLITVATYWSHECRVCSYTTALVTVAICHTFAIMYALCDCEIRAG